MESQEGEGRPQAAGMGSRGWVGAGEPLPSCRHVGGITKCPPAVSGVTCMPGLRARATLANLQGHLEPKASEGERVRAGVGNDPGVKARWLTRVERGRGGEACHRPRVNRRGKGRSRLPSDLSSVSLLCGYCESLL